MFLEKKIAADLFDGLFEFNTDHQSASTHLLDARKLVKLLKQIGADLRGIVHQMLLLHDVEHCNCTGASQMVAAERCAQHAIDRLEHRTDQHGAHREAIGDAFGHRDQIGTDAGMLMGKELAASAVSALYLIENQDSLVTRTEIAQLAHEVVGRELYAANTLNAFDDDARYIALLQLVLDSLRIVQRKVGDIEILIDGSDDLGIIGDSDRSGSTSVERVLESDDMFLAVVERGQLECIFIGFGSGVDQKSE
jgi:hypothetical protein